MKNWYILYVLSQKIELLLFHLNRNNNIEAFVPQYEYYRRIDQTYDTKPMFPGYIFVKTNMNQAEFNSHLFTMKDERDGLIRQLVKSDTSALTEDEKDMFIKILDDDYIARISYGEISNNKVKILRGPLKYYENNIIKVDKHNRIAVLNLIFLNRNIKLGLLVI